MRKKYSCIVLNIDKDWNIDATKCSNLVKESVLKNRDVIYIYFGKKSVYIGQSTHWLDRHMNHKASKNVGIYDHVIIVYGSLIDGNSKNYIEKMLITLFTADNEEKIKFRIANGTIGNSSNDFLNKEKVDASVIYPLWTQTLSDLGLVKNTQIDELKKSILFAYSPFKELTNTQNKIIKSLLEDPRNSVIEGGSGTGKTVLLTNLAAQLRENISNDKKIAVVVKANWRDTCKKIFKRYGIEKGVYIGSWGQVYDTRDQFEYILVDEAHRLPRYYGKLHPSERKYFDKEKHLAKDKKNALYLLGKKTDNLILLFDRNQTIRPSDIPLAEFENYTQDNGFCHFYLETQLRIDIHDKGKNYTAEDFIKGIKFILQLSEDDNFSRDLFCNPDEDSYFGLVDSIEDLFKYIHEMDDKISCSKNRVIAGYAREWISKVDKERLDWNNKWKWNSTYINWIYSERSEEEIGSIHAIQGVDLNCVGLIIGRDLVFRDGKVIASKENYFDKNGKPILADFTEAEFTTFIKNIYYILMTRGIDGIRIYIEDPELKRHFESICKKIC